jgi:hypothetical protein
MVEKEKYVRDQLSPMMEDIDKFIDGLLESAKDDEDKDRAMAIIIYATSIKSFSNSGNWRRQILRITKLLKTLKNERY